MRQEAIGLSVSWAYAPGELRVLTSQDDGSFEEAAGWRKLGRAEASYGDILMFDEPRRVKSVAVVMRSPRPWRYFGIKDIALLVKPGPSMVISGISSALGELCLVSEGSRLATRPCMQAIAAGTGDDVFALNDDSQFVSQSTGKCMSLARMDTVRAPTPLLEDCASALEAGDGRSILALTPAGQLKWTAMGNYCVTVGAQQLRAAACIDPAGMEGSVGSDQIWQLVAVPEFDPAPAARLQEVASLVRASAARQAALLQDLERRLPLLEACSLSHLNPLGLVSVASEHASNMSTRSELTNATGQAPAKAAAPGSGAPRGIGEVAPHAAYGPPRPPTQSPPIRWEPALEAMRQIGEANGVDMAGLRLLISKSKAAMMSH